MKFTTVKSSNIDGVHFDPATGTLTVKFKLGGTYHYDACKQEHFDGLCKAESAGKYLHKTIRGSFKHRKADPPKKH